MKKIMKISDIKEKMKKYRDFYGGDLFGFEEIDKATTKEELRIILDQHRDHMCNMLSDAYGHIDRFIERVGLSDIDL